MSLVKPNILAEALGITTDALRKRRSRVTKSSKLNTDAYDYTVTGVGRVMYQLDSLPPSVRATVEKITTKRTKQKHEDLMLKDFRYANSLGKVNARKKKIHEAEVLEAARKLREKEQIAQEVFIQLVENRTHTISSRVFKEEILKRKSEV